MLNISHVPRDFNVSWHDLIPGFKRVSRHEGHAPCWRCGGRDRWVGFNSGRGWCRQCGWSGDAIQLLRDRDGLTFSEAKRTLGLDSSPFSPQQRTRAKIHNSALAQARHAYRAWERQKLGELAEHYRALLAKKEVAEVAYRAIHRRQDLYTLEERSFWTRTLASLYDRIAELEHSLNVLTFNDYEAARFAWWREECAIAQRERVRRG
jgi:phage/plasmid primase-like uncharacterized protein